MKTINVLYEPVARPILTVLTFVGECSILLFKSAAGLLVPPFEGKEVVNQMAFLGAGSVPIVLITCFSSGATLSLFLTLTLRTYHADQFIGATGGIALTREVVPVLSAVAFAARAGAAMASQIGTMATTEQIDALKMLSVRPEKYLVMTRVVASVCMLPILSLIGLYAAGLGGALVAMAYDVTFGNLLNSVQTYVAPWDLTGGLLKTPVFGLIVALVCCQQGLRTTGGAEGVGKSTTNAVVVSIVLIYAANYALAVALFR